jgi:hypothetical protein
VKIDDFSWMNKCDNKKTRSVNKAIKSAEKLYMNIAIKGKTRKAFEGF